MEMEMVFRDVEGTPEMKEFVEAKSEKLKHFFASNIQLKWTITREKDEHISHLHVHANSIDFFGETREHNFKSSVEHTVEKLERQLKKRKEVIKDHHR